MEKLYTTNKPIIILALVVLAATTAIIGETTVALSLFLVGLGMELL